MTRSGHASTAVLIVEDDFDVRDTLGMTLEAEGYRVEGAANGQEAIERLQRADPPCLILLDLMMPVMDGWEFRAAQLRDPTLARIPVVVISADGSVARKASALGVAGYLRKPLDFDALLQTVRRHC